MVTSVPADLLWDYLADYDRVVRLGWDQGSAQRMDDADDGTVRYQAHTDWQGIVSDYTVSLEDADRPNTLTWRTKTGGSESWVRFDITPLDSIQTEVMVTLNLKHGAALRMLEPFAWGLLWPALEKTRDRIGRLSREELVRHSPASAQDRASE